MTKMDEGCSVRHLSKRDSELNQKQTIYGRGRECPFFSTPSFYWFWHYVDKCLDGQALTWINRKTLWQVREDAVCPSSETDRQSEERKEKEEERRWKITLPVSIGLDCWPPPPLTKNFFTSNIGKRFLQIEFSISEVFSFKRKCPFTSFKCLFTVSF